MIFFWQIYEWELDDSFPSLVIIAIFVVMVTVTVLASTVIISNDDQGNTSGGQKSCGVYSFVNFLQIYPSRPLILKVIQNRK